MNTRYAAAPLYVDSFALCEWLLGHFGDDPRCLPTALCQSALALFSSVTLALKGRRRDEHLEEADEHLIRLRAQLRLAHAVNVLVERVVVLRKAVGVLEGAPGLLSVALLLSFVSCEANHEYLYGGSGIYGSRIYGGSRIYPGGWGRRTIVRRTITPGVTTWHNEEESKSE